MVFVPVVVKLVVVPEAILVRRSLAKDSLVTKRTYTVSPTFASVVDALLEYISIGEITGGVRSITTVDESVVVVTI